MKKDNISKELLYEMQELITKSDEIFFQQDSLHRKITKYIQSVLEHIGKTYICNGDFSAEVLREYALADVNSMGYDGGKYPYSDNRLWSNIYGLGIDENGLYASIDADKHYEVRRWRYEDGIEAFEWLQEYICILRHEYSKECSLA